MYRDFFRLDRMPFDNTPDPRFFFATPEHEEALAALRYGVLQRRGITIVTGAPGCGKTLLGRVLVAALQGQIDAAFVATGHDSGHELIAAVCRAFDVRHAPSDTTGELIDHLHAVLSDRLADGHIPTVFVDDGQDLSCDTLEHLRLLGNLETETGKLLQVVLMGQPELAARLRTAGLEPIRQRVFCSRRIAPFTLPETRAYVRHRLTLAGAAEDPALFTDGAVELIHERSGGVPRWINQIADNTLLVAFGVSRSTVDRELVLEAIDHMMSVQLLPLRGLEGEACGPGPAGTAGARSAAPHVGGIGVDTTRAAAELLERLAQASRLAERQIGTLSATTAAAESTITRLDAGQRTGTQTAAALEQGHERFNAALSETDRAAARIDSVLRTAREQADDTARALESRNGDAADLLKQLRSGQDILRGQLAESEALVGRLQAQLHAATAAAAQAAGLSHQLTTAEQTSATLRARVDEGAGLADRLHDGLRALGAAVEEAWHTAATTRAGALEAQTAGAELEQTVRRLGQAGQTVAAELAAKSDLAVEWLDRLQTGAETLGPAVAQAQDLTQELRTQGDKLRAAAECAQAMGTHLERLHDGAEAALGQTLQQIEHALQRATEAEQTITSTTERSRTYAATLAATAQAWHEQLNGLLRDLKDQVREVQEASHQAMYAPLRAAGAKGDIAAVRELLHQSLNDSRAEKSPA